MKKTKTTAVVLGVLLGTCCAGAYNLYPTYVVTTTGEGTNDIADVAVEVTASAGATPVTKAFTALDKSAANFKGTFVKRGTGFLRSSNAMANFTGEIVIENGALIADLTGDLGPGDVNLAPTVTVSRTGTAYFTASKAKQAHFYNIFNLEGEGYKGLGAVHSAIQTSQNDYMFYAPWHLMDDTRLGMSGPYRFDFKAVSTGSTLNLHDHTLTITNFIGGINPYIGLYSAPVDPGAGHIRQHGGSMFIHGVTWKGAETNTLTFSDGVRLVLQGSRPNVNWTAGFLGDNSIEVNGSVYSAFDNSFSYNFYPGPVALSNGTLAVTGGTASPTNGFTFKGPVCGDSAIKAENAWLMFAGRTNDLHGAVSVSRTKSGRAAGLGIFDPKAFDDRAASVTFTNAALAVFDGVTAYRGGALRLGPTAFHVSADTNMCILAATNRSFATCDEGKPLVMTLASLRKTGAGRLDLCGAVAVTGLLDVAEGTVRLRAPVARRTIYSTQPGLSFRVGETNRLGEAQLTYDSNWERTCSHYGYNYKGFRGSNWSFTEEGVAPSVYLAGVSGTPYWHTFMSAEYVGYIWNRTGQTVTWRFAGAVTDAYKFYVDGKSVGALYDSSNATFENLSLTNGPHKIEITLWSRIVAGGARTPTKKHPFWNKPGMGFAICTNETKVAEATTNAVDYIVPKNATEGLENAGGDGLWFTRDARWPESIPQADLDAFWTAERTSFTGLRLAAGATLDLAGGTNAVATVEGAGTVANGSLTVTERLTHTGTAPLVVDGTLAFGAGAVLAVDDPLLVKRGALRTLATAEKIEGLPNASAIFAETPGRVGVSADGHSLVLQIFRAGTALIVR